MEVKVRKHEWEMLQRCAGHLMHLHNKNVRGDHATPIEDCDCSLADDYNSLQRFINVVMG